MAVRHPGEKLSVIAMHNPELCKLLVSAHLGALQVVLNNLGNTRLQWSIKSITEHYNDLYVSDLILFVKMMTRGRYGKPYGDPTPQYIFECFAKYYEERENVRAEYRERKHDRIKSDMRIIDNEAYAKWREKVRAEMAEPKPDPVKQVLNHNEIFKQP